MKAQPVYKGFYDHHIDTYLITDVSSKSQAQAMHINYSAELKGVKGLPEQYFVRGRAAKGQLTIFGSQPGEADYNPSGKRSGSPGRRASSPSSSARTTRSTRSRRRASSPRRTPTSS
jgi:hypothetical protein